MSLPRAVFLTPTLPARTGNGLAMRMGLFLEALCRFAEVDVIVVPMVEGANATMASGFLEELGARLHTIPVSVETRFSLLMRIIRAESRLDAFRGYGKPSLASALSPPVLRSIGKIIEDRAPDIVHIGRAYLSESAKILPPHVIATLDLDEDDRASFASQARLARCNGDAISADWLNQEGLACDALISSFGPRFDCVFVASEREATLLAGRHKGLKFQVIANAVAVPRRIVRHDDGATFLFVGSLGYFPNVEGLLWFASKVLPRLRAMHKTAGRLLIAGAQPPAVVSALGRDPRVSVLGRVSNVGLLYQRATLALAPMRAGGGTRIKLLEAAAHGVASVSTSVAAEGIGWRNDAGGWRGGSASEFAAACRDGLLSANERNRRAMAGLDWVRRHHSRDHVVALISHTLQTVLEKRRSGLAGPRGFHRDPQPA